MNRMGITSSACIFTFAEVSFTIDFTLNTEEKIRGGMVNIIKFFSGFISLLNI